MKPSAYSSAPPSRAESLRHLPADAHAAFARFQAGHNPADLDPVILAILEDFIPDRAALPLAGRPGGTRLIDDLGFDSLAITEVVFFAEDLFGISISNEEITQVRTLDALHGFILGKATARAAR